MRTIRTANHTYDMNNNSKFQSQPQNMQAQQILLQQLQSNGQLGQSGNYDYDMYNYRMGPYGQGQTQGQNQLLPLLPLLPSQNNHQQPPYLRMSNPPGQNLQYALPLLPHQHTTESINVTNPGSVYWQHQQQLCQMSRTANVPHFYARQYAANSRKKNPYSEVKSMNLVDATKQVVAVLEEQERLVMKLTITQNPALLHNKKMTTDYDDDHMQEEQRMRLKSQGRQLWCQLDLSGQGLTILSPKLFQYEFLESLFLNNNKLTEIPPVISRLKSLRTLDLSRNRISEVPPELGMCFNLRYLFLFDNNITTLPLNFGNLIELLFLGIEGNPLDLKIANIVAEQGTKELVAYLRDTKPGHPAPNPRPWLLLEDDGEVIDPTTNPEAYSSNTSDSEPDSFTLLSYNTLCQHYAPSKLYKFTPSWALDWEFRRAALKEEVLSYKTDVVCMQEVETRTFHDFWVPVMAEIGYKGVFFCKTRSKTMGSVDSKKVDGCATFYKSSKFELLTKMNFEYNSVCMGSDKYKKTKDLFNRFMNKDNIALITYLQHLESGEKILVTNTHLHWDPAFNDVKALQVGILLEELQGVLKKFGHTDDVKNANVVICGDFNSVKDSAVYQLFSSGSVTKHPDLDGRDYGRFTDEGFKHVFKLKSAYDGELPFTNFSPGFTEVIDYIWYTPGNLRVKGLLGKIDDNYLKNCIGFPDAHFPSDHIAIVTKFQIKKGISSARRPDFKPDFKGTSRKT